ncbi:MAG: prolyl oligopeptidase family serine peptidase [Crocinitomicaceae bacterium]|nr:prolyl oligopeptidase family serine peptidase [Crocinitomicaceae bacterium]
MRINRKNNIFQGAEGKQSLYDIVVPDEWNNKLIIFLHGYMGYKDWGCWNLVSDYFTEENYGFLKYNVSHNGGTLENPIDFSDLESFSRNTYAFEIQDFEAILEEVERAFNGSPDIYIIGHSRGGALSLLQSSNGHVKKIVSWAGVATLHDRFPKGKELESWATDGLLFRKNGRTNQQMPHHYSQYKSFLHYEDRLNIKKYCLNSDTPTLVVHGDKDASVDINEGKLIAQWLNTDLVTIEGAAHTFGSSQPWKESSLPKELQLTCQKTLDFFQEEVPKN